MRRVTRRCGYLERPRCDPEISSLIEGGTVQKDKDSPDSRFWGKDQTTKIMKALQALAPQIPLNEQFLRIVAEGTGKIFKPEDNRSWETVTRPILEAFFHAHYFLEMAVKYGRELKVPPQTLPSGWAAVLYLYNLR
jgi:hypothetical protein